MIGVYAIRNKVNGKMIIGSAQDIKKRWSNYLTLLRKGEYGNKYLQDEWNKYGEENFEFIVVEELTRKRDLSIVEKYWQDYYRAADMLYNKNKVRKTKKKLRRGKEAANHKEKMSAVQSGENNPRHAGKLTTEDVIMIKQMIDQGMKNKEIHANFKDKTTSTMISRIRTGNRYKSVKVGDVG
ncbi:GIY-YIG nuclease family protein [Paenibacillus alkalitolerans]|uniref:GIY-YIG nuclease family protein n=1 Tax=Paenibacillus alkalitolerans TaxID=2799335 RepID=UPI0018F2B637|nr:GIY-YIG nuclease family protein [Paenibacillus alkalitolerans]